MNSADYVKCLKVVLESRLQREGHILMPVGDSSVETVTDLQRALQLTRQYLIPGAGHNGSTN